MKTLAMLWIRWRYGRVYALKPPLGRPPWRTLLWEIECRLFARYGHEQREAWLRYMDEAGG